MSDNAPNFKGSFSVYVPESADNATHETYFRLGGGNPYNPDGEPFKDYDKKFGVYLFTDGSKNEVIKGDKLDLKLDGSKLISAEYEFDLAEGGMQHKSEWTRASSSKVSLSDETELSFGYSCKITMSAAQEIKVAIPFTASLGPSLEAKLDPLAIAFSPNGMKVESAIPKLNDFELNTDKDTRAATFVSMTAAPHDLAGLTAIKGCVIAYQVAIGAVSAVSAALMIVPMSGTSAVADENSTKNDEVKEWLRAQSISGATMGSLVTLLQVAGIVLGAVAIGVATAAKPLDQVASGKVVVTPKAAQMRVGATSFIEMTPASIVINAPNVRIQSTQQMNLPALTPPMPL